MGLVPALAVPEPNTWRDLLKALDDKSESLPLKGKRLAVQEYGASNAELLRGLEERGARVTRVPVYQWALPEDVGPLRGAAEKIARGEIDVALFTTSIQVTHLLKIAAEMNIEDAARRAFSSIFIASIGPITSEELREQGLDADFEPSHPKMGFLVNEAAERATQILGEKRGRATS
jgi:uroporphyrinogen-III synthase